ncbi:MAG: hypothetical protein OEO84_06890 [Betaproteobacteria bacterium]|nr:hypothetical protein [Betaproteobacteria bacterium]
MRAGARFDPDEFGELRDSRRGIYRLLGKSVRTLGAQQEGFERLHVSPVTRAERNPARHQPRNLETYLMSPDCKIDVSAP